VSAGAAIYYSRDAKIPGPQRKSRLDVDTDTVLASEAGESAAALLAAYTDAVKCGRSDAAGQVLGKLLRDHAQPVIGRVTRLKLFSGSFRGQTCHAHDEEDVRSTVTLQLILRLRNSASSGASIESFAAYVAGITQNCCNQLLRRKYPQYTRLKNRTRYLLRHDPQFALWQSEGEQWLSGLAAWKDETVGSFDRGVFEPVDLDAFSRSSLRGRNVAQMKPDELVQVLLTWRGRPLALDELVKALASLYDIRDIDTAANHSDDSDASLGDLLATASADAIWLLDARSSLERLWTEIRGLPRSQRVALLLNLRDVQRRDALTLLPMTGIASLRDIADVLEIAPERFAEMWNALPLDDLSIGALLRVSRQQVINLRKSARERLTRRMASWRGTGENA
jgi:hypothetical protein